MLVSLIGAGPGDAGLLTLKGAERLGKADVVLFDRFVSAEILALIPEDAEKIDVGKTAGKHPVPQATINRLLLEKAQQGLNVVRLKGGDPFVFGRGAEELELLVEHNIPFEVVPGVTSAIAGAAYAGIPVTHRDYVSAVHIITGHGKNHTDPNINYNALVRAKGTLVFLMAVATIQDISAGLIAAGIDPKLPGAVVENATTNQQRKFIGTVATLPQIAAANNLQSPAVIIIGNVCALADQCDWFSKRPLFGQQIIVARAKPGASGLAAKLRDLGAQVAELAPSKIIPLTGPGSALDQALQQIDNYSWLVFTSGIGVKVFFDHLIQTGFDIRRLHQLKLACVGPETAKELQERGINADYWPGEYNGAALAAGLVERVSSADKLLIARAADGAEDLVQILKAAGIPFVDLAIYQKSHASRPQKYPDASLAAFTSSSAVEWFIKSAPDTDFSTLKAVCIGAKTADTARAYGMEVELSAESTVDSIIDKIKELSKQ